MLNYLAGMMGIDHVGKNTYTCTHKTNEQNKQISNLMCASFFMPPAKFISKVNL